MKSEILPSDYTICAYMRLSHDDGDFSAFKVESGSISSQRKLIRDFISRQPEFAKCNVIERCDDGYSGTKFDTRPQFTAMISLAKQGKINCIIVKDCSRFGRDYVELGNYLEQLFPFWGVRFISINDGYDSDKIEGGMDIAFKNLVYDFYTRDMAKKNRLAKERLALQGKYMGSQTLYGYMKSTSDKHKLELDTETAPIVREIFEMRLSGRGLLDIARELNDRGILCPTAYSANKARTVCRKGDINTMVWSERTIQNILDNEIYTGTMVGMMWETGRNLEKRRKRPDDKIIRVGGTHEAIVTKEEFRAVQGIMKNQKGLRKPGTHNYYFCGVCGRRLVRREKGAMRCWRSDVFSEDISCSEVKIDREYADWEILKSLKEKLRRILRVEEMRIQTAKHEVPAEEQIRAMELKLEEIDAEKQKLFERLLDRSISREAFKSRKVEMDAQIRELEMRISDLKAANDLSDDGSRVEEIKSFLETKEMTEDVWDRFVEGVMVYPGKKLEIRWSFEG